MSVDVGSQEVLSPIRTMANQQKGTDPALKLSFINS